MRDGIIELDSKRGGEFGFTSARFGKGSYLWKDGTAIYVSMILSKRPGEGALSMLFKAILDKGYGIRVPTPSGLMLTILLMKGFKRRFDWFQGKKVECWCLDSEGRTWGE